MCERNIRLLFATLKGLIFFQNTETIMSFLYLRPYWTLTFAILCSCSVLQTLLLSESESSLSGQHSSWEYLCADIVYCKQISASLFSSSAPGFTAQRNGLSTERGGAGRYSRVVKEGTELNEVM